MPDPGYGPNGERLDPSGAITWGAQAPPIPYIPGDDVYLIFPLGEEQLPAIDQNDDEVFASVYLGGFP